MNRTYPRIALAALSALCLASAFVSPARAAERKDGARRDAALSPLHLPGVRSVPIRKRVAPKPKPPAIEGVKGAANFCAAIAASAASTRLAWQEARIKALQKELLAKTAELDAKEAEVRGWVKKREQLLAKASKSLTAIYAKMKPDAAAAQLQAMDDDTAAALLLKLRPMAASAVMGEMDPARAARLSDLLTGVSPKSDGKKS